MNLLREILKTYQPDKQIARRNTIRRRKHKKKIMELMKQNILMKLGLKPDLLRSKNSDYEDNAPNSSGANTQGKKPYSHLQRRKQLTLQNIDFLSQRNPTLQNDGNLNTFEIDKQMDGRLQKDNSDTSSIGTIIKKQNTEMVSLGPSNFFGAMMGNALSSCDKNSSRFMKKDSIVNEYEEECIYFQYNSDGEFHPEERHDQIS